MANQYMGTLSGYSRKPGFSFQLNHLFLLASVIALAIIFFVQAYRQSHVNTQATHAANPAVTAESRLQQATPR